jgi:hypothetical protein
VVLPVAGHWLAVRNSRLAAVLRVMRPFASRSHSAQRVDLRRWDRPAVRSLRRSERGSDRPLVAGRVAAVTARTIRSAIRRRIQQDDRQSGEYALAHRDYQGCNLSATIRTLR